MRDGAQLAGIAIERQRTMQALIHDARHDSLTGLPNRAAIFAYLDEALAHTTPASKVAVLFVDLDGLKALNDTLGHDRADEMIREIGQRLSAAPQPRIDRRDRKRRHRDGATSIADGRDAIRQADSAMYSAKRTGGGGCSFFEGSQRPHTGFHLKPPGPGPGGSPTAGPCAARRRGG